MSKASTEISGVPAAERGCVIQRVMVDRWSPAQAGAHYGVPERQVARWVAAYRRHGMASLRDDAGLDRATGRWMRRLRGVIVRICRRPGSGQGAGQGADPARCIVLRPGDDTSPASGAHRRIR